MTGILAWNIAVPAGIWFASRTEVSLAFIGAAVLFLPLFVFLPKLMKRAAAMDAQAVVEAFGKNEHVMRVIWVLSITIVGLMITKVLDPAAAQ